MIEVFTVVDVETTGLDHTADHLTEIAAIRVELSTDGTYREIGRFNTFVALPPGAEIPPFITELTGIKAADLAGAPDWWNAISSLRTFAAESIVVAHNAPFDLAFLQYGFSPTRFVCTRALSRLLEPAESARLADVCTRYDIDLTGHHRAINDVEATVKVLAVFWPRIEAESVCVEYRNVVIDSEERPLTFIPRGAAVRKITKEAAA